MTPDIIGDSVMFLAAVATICLVFDIGGLVADYVFPHTPIQRHFFCLVFTNR